MTNMTPVETTHSHPHGFAHHFRDLAHQKDTTGFGMWVFIAQEVMFFGGLFLAYAIYRSSYPDVFAAASHHLNVPLGAFNTAVLICSSLTMALAVHAAAVGDRRRIVTFLLLTVLLGSVFLGVKVVEYKDKYDHRLVPGPNFSGHSLSLEGDRAQQAQMFYSLYFAMTGLHALHMIIGIPIILWIAARARRGDFTAEYNGPVEITGLYWHFVDIIWIFLFPLLYLIA
jgi:cytochrome c oxidase subunit III